MKLGFDLTARVGNPAAAVGETLALPLLVVGSGIYLNPTDPLWIHGPFPWTWLAPIVLALRYGALAGLAATAIVVLAWAAFSLFSGIDGDFPKLNFLGGLTLVMLSSEFSSLWSARVRRAEGARSYLEQRFEYLTHQYYALRLSHDCLEQDLISRPVAMRDALTELRDLAAKSDPSAPLPGAQALLGLLAAYCQLEAAALYGCSGGRCTPAPVASLGGAAADLDPADPLVRFAFDNGTLAHVAQTLGGGKHSSRYIVAVPLRTFDGQCIGLLTVERMPFLALQEETLQSLNVLLRYYSDCLAILGISAFIRGHLPFCPPDFAVELQRLWHMRREFGFKSVMVALEFRSPEEFNELVLHLGRHKRSIDVTWLIRDSERKVLITLMPLAGMAAAEGYLSGIEDWVFRKNGQSLVDAGIFSHVLEMDHQPPLVLLQRILDSCHVRVDTCPLTADT